MLTYEVNIGERRVGALGRWEEEEVKGDSRTAVAARGRETGRELRTGGAVGACMRWPLSASQLPVRYAASQRQRALCRGQAGVFVRCGAGSWPYLSVSSSWLLSTRGLIAFNTTTVVCESLSSWPPLGPPVLRNVSRSPGTGLPLYPRCLQAAMQVSAHS